LKAYLKLIALTVSTTAELQDTIQASQFKLAELFKYSNQESRSSTRRFGASHNLTAMSIDLGAMSDSQDSS
jgi:hypothetical protein